ncbi:replication protein RepA [Acidisphaera sp. L21]|uniref:replication protein RepA n=1 Tax=Acidisphaera sp. L21 TaxID=1641851 RepID=UPI00131EB2B1|nr:replication protein RepA [Acidisphaera sp. L21]
MAQIHQLILRDGIDEAKKKAATKHERALVEAAYQVLSEDAEKMGFTYSGFALTSLPHKPPKELFWRREGHNITLLLESGRDRVGVPVGVPYGSYARFILLFLQSEAVKTGSREIELGRSMRVWLGTMGLSIGGQTYKAVSEQAKRISNCRLQFFATKGEKEVMRHGGFVDGSITMAGLDSDQPALWNDRVLLNKEFYRALREHPVPVSEAGLRAIGPRSMVIDVYIWLAYRLHSLTNDATVSWLSLHGQFGAGFQLLRKFRAHFIECLELATAAYPDARVEVTEAGVILKPSRPAIAKL